MYWLLVHSLKPDLGGVEALGPVLLFRKSSWPSTDTVYTHVLSLRDTQENISGTMLVFSIPDCVPYLISSHSSTNISVSVSQMYILLQHSSSLSTQSEHKRLALLRPFACLVVGKSHRRRPLTYDKHRSGQGK